MVVHDAIHTFAIRTHWTTKVGVVVKPEMVADVVFLSTLVVEVVLVSAAIRESRSGLFVARIADMLFA